MHISLTLLDPAVWFSVCHMGWGVNFNGRLENIMNHNSFAILSKPNNCVNGSFYSFNTFLKLLQQDLKFWCICGQHKFGRQVNRMPKGSCMHILIAFIILTYVLVMSCMVFVLNKQHLLECPHTIGRGNTNLVSKQETR